MASDLQVRPTGGLPVGIDRKQNDEPPPALPTRRTLVFPKAHAHLELPGDPIDAIVKSVPPPIPTPRQSERPTLPTLPPPPPESTDSGEEVVLSGSVLESDRGDMPSSSDELEPRKRARRWIPASVIANVTLASVLLLVLLVGDKGAEQRPRVPNVALSERTPFVAPPAMREPSPPSGACVMTGTARVLARRAQLGPGVDVTPLDTGFGVGLAASASEAIGVRIEGSSLRVAETVRVRSISAPKHVAAMFPADDDGLDLRIDSDDARTIVPDEAPAFRIAARGSFVVVESNGTQRTLWPLPGVNGGHPRFPRPTPDVAVRAAPTEEGGLVAALRRPGVLYFGVAELDRQTAGLVATTPLVALPRASANVGTPAIAAFGSGGAVAWAERAIGAHDWSIVLTTFAPNDEGKVATGLVRAIGTGMSPSIAALPDGDLLVAYADGPSGAHRVVARRLSRDLNPRGEPIVLSPESTNAGQPVAAVRADGRGMVAFFAAEKGRPASVLATPVVCDPGL